jgi:hypothetical protein
MIYINPARIKVSADLTKKCADLALELSQLSKDKRNDFINSKRLETWGHNDVLKALRDVVGDKCWYSEVSLAGADANVDHFRPKGNVKEIDDQTLTPTGKSSEGYWWLAFDIMNYRLSSVHSNQRRVDETTSGGKWDYFPIIGQRALSCTALSLITENILPLDPCSASDVALMWFGPDGAPGYSNWRREASDFEKKRMLVTIWLFHLDKQTTSIPRAKAIDSLKLSIMHANTVYKIWEKNNFSFDSHEKILFDNYISQIKEDCAEYSEFSGAKQCTLKIAAAEYPWIVDYFF